MSASDSQPIQSLPEAPAGTVCSSAAGRGTGCAPRSRYRGVHWDRLNRRWVVHICKDSKQRHIGCFIDEIEAAKAYDDAARAAFGEWASPNFPTDAEREFAAKWYDTEAAARFFGLSRYGWKNWVRAGRIKGGRMVPSSRGGKRKVYTLEELERIKQDLFGDDKLYKDGGNKWHVPPGLVCREDAWRMFGVQKVTWERWEREGWITCGTRIPGGPKLYRIEDIERLLAENGSLRPPYPDPERPNCYRVPLGGHDMRRREAIIDAESLPLIGGGTCSMGATTEGAEFVSFNLPGRMRGMPLRRLIMGVAHTKLNVGHVNGDPLDCRKANLKVKTALQRARGNRKMKQINGKPPTSRYKGVFWETQTGKWRARIRVHGKNWSLGRFDDEVEAAQMYDWAARKFFGTHAWLNFPDESSRACDVAVAMRDAA